MAKRKQDEREEPLSCQPGPPPAPLVVESAGPREVLPEFNSLDKLVEVLRTCKRVVVVTGAGISVSCGIPDFRSENGVYDLASRLDLGLSCAEDLFDLEFFVHDPEPFFKFAKVLYPGNYTPSLTHRFIKALEIRGKLLRNFTQNIDGLEAQVGLKKYVACHGSFLTATCLGCKKKRTAEDIREEVMRQEVPRCPACKQGVVKPDITFFGEKLPSSVKRAVEADHKKADLFLVLGTSLKVQPVSRILQFFPRHVPQVLVNRELIRPPRQISDGFDLHLLGDCDDVVRHLCERLGWELPPPTPPAEAPPPLPPPTPPPPPPATTAAPTTAALPPPIGAPPPPAAAGAGDDAGGEKKNRTPPTPPPLPPPTFVPPNSYTFPSREAAAAAAAGGESAGGRRSAAWAALSGGGAGEENAGDDDDFEEVVTCDGCDKVIEGEIYACGRCFGYDLCGICYGGGSNNHSRETGHSFQRSRSLLGGAAAGAKEEEAEAEA